MKHFLIVVMFFSGLSVYGQCPGLPNNNPQFCDLQQPVVGDLAAIDNGAGFAWFATVSSTTALAPSRPLIDGEVLYLDNAAGNCGNRQTVTVTVTGKPLGVNFQGLCANAGSPPTVWDLSAVGNDVRWYSAPFGGTPLNPNTVLVDGNDYYADQENPVTGCRSSRLSVRVSLITTGRPTGPAVQRFCVDQGIPTVADLQASGNNQWYANASSAVPLAFNTPLVNGEDYYATTFNTPCESTQRLRVDVIFENGPNAGSNSSVSYCSSDLNNLNTIDLFSLLGGMPDSGGTWSGSTPVSGALGTINVSDLSSAGSPFLYDYTIVSSNLCPDDSATIQIVVNDPPSAGIDGQIEICIGDPALDLFTVLGGNPDSGGTWSPALNSGTGLFNPNTDNAGLYTYTVNGTGACTQTESATINVIINPAPDAGTGVALDFCENDPPVDLFALLGGTPDGGGVWIPALNSGTGVFDPSIDLSGVYVYSVTGPSCSNTDTANVSVTVTDLPNAGNSTSISICENDAPIDLFSQLAGNPDQGGTWTPALASGTGVFNPNLDPAGTYTYNLSIGVPCNSTDSAQVSISVEQLPDAGLDSAITMCESDPVLDLFNLLGGTPDAGGSWTPALNSGTGIFDPSLDVEGTYTYTVGGTSVCPSGSSASVSVTVDDLPEAGDDGNLEICENESAIDLFSLLGNDAETGGSWTPTLDSGSGIFDPAVDPAGTYTYEVVDNGVCNAIDVAQVTVVVRRNPDAGINGDLDVCDSDPTLDLRTALGGQPDTGGTWSPALASGTSLFDPSIDASGIYTYTINPTTPCMQAASSTVTVNVITTPFPGTDANVELCRSDASIDLFTLLGGTPEPGGVWSPSLNSGSGIFNPSIDSAGIYSYTLVGSPCQVNPSASVTVSIQAEADAGIDSSITLCDDDSPIDLFTVLGGTPNIGGIWSPALASSTGVFDPALDSSGTYTYSVDSVSPCAGMASATVSVTIEVSANAGLDGTIELCENHAPVNLFNVLGGNPDTGGTWSPNLVSGSGIFDPAIDAAGDYTYTISSMAPCTSTATSTVTVNVSSLPSPGLDASVELCEGDSPIDLFTILVGNPTPNGVWSPSLSGGAGIFDPSVDSTGTYTYTVTPTAPCSGTLSATVDVTLNPIPDAGMDTTFSICESDNPVDLFTVLGGTPDPGGTWSPSLSGAAGIFDPSVDMPGVYTYTIPSNGCGGDLQSTVTVTVDTVYAVNSAQILPEPEVCLGEDNQVLIDGLNPLPDGFYDFLIILAGANNTTVTDVLEVMGESTIYSIPGSLLTQAGLTSLTVIRIDSADLICPIVVDPIPEASFEVITTDNLQYPADATAFCKEDMPAIADLSINVPGQNVRWYESASGGNPLADQTALVNGSTYFAEAINALGCSSPNRVAVTVLVESCEVPGIVIPDGFSPNGDGINDTFDIRNLRTKYPNFSLEIYNRNGYLVFRGNNNRANWDGLNHGAAGSGSDVLAAGVYFYILDLKEGEPIQGRVYLNK